ncbi:DUF6000 family protein [Streptomyces sp. NPDC057694]|uniref:DUF6000 family protein n=1 Tax=Streptomyces sp. NPDC057694 TaxID=3346216 RepID=UPI0036961751
MRTDHDPELDELRRRYVALDRRYLRLNYGIFRLSERERHRLAGELAQAADAITPRELDLLLDCGWRERKTAAWLIAIADRTAFRHRLGELLLASEVCYAGHAYCITLAAFGTSADAELLVTYLDRYLARPDLDYDQTSALGALLHLDATHDTDHATRLLAPDGPWQQWVQAQPHRRELKPAEYQETMARYSLFVRECARHRAASGER